MMDATSVRALLALPLAFASALQEPDLELRPWAAPSDGASALPSWVAGGAPELLHVELAGKNAATLVLRTGGSDGTSAVRTVLGAGETWFLNWADVPAAARLADGTLAWAWLELDAAHPHSYATRFSVADGELARRSEPRPLEEHRGAGEHGFVALAPLDETRFLALWLDGRAASEHDGETRVYARTLGRAGELGPETLVDPRACSCCPTSLVRLADGTLLAAWRDRSADEERDVALARFDGHAWSAPELLHRDGWKIDGCPVNGPRLAVSAASGREVAAEPATGRVAATWYTGADGGAVLVAFGDEQGRAFGGPIRVDDGAPEGRGDAAFLPDASLLVAWMEHGAKASSWRVRRVRPDGQIGPTLVVAEVSSERASGFARMTSGGGGALLAYTETLPERRVVVRALVPRR